MILFAQAAKDRGLFFNGRQLPYKTSLTEFARELRTNMTPSEKRVYQYLKALGGKVRAQHPVDRYIVDFYLPAFDLVIEIDGEQHYSGEGKEYDKYRDAILESYGLHVVRITNIDVQNDFSIVVSRLKVLLDSIHSEK